MAELQKLTDAIVHEYLKTKDKNLAKVFEQKAKVVSSSGFLFICFFFFLMHLYAFAHDSASSANVRYI